MNTVTFKSLVHKAKLEGKTDTQAVPNVIHGILKHATITAPLKYLSIFGD